MRHLRSFLLLFVFLLPGLVSAETVVRIGDAIVVDDTQVVDGDYYVSVGPFGNTTMSGAISGDMYALGGSVTTNGSVLGDLSIVSGVSQLHASVTDDVRVVSGEVVVAEHIGGDLFVIGGLLKVLSTASVDGNVYFFGGEAIVDGAISGSIHGTMQKLRIDGPVGEGIDITARESLTLGSKANIVGDISYKSDNLIVRAPSAVVEGDITREKEPVVTEQESLQDALIPLFIILFAALSIYLLFRNELIALYQNATESHSRSVLVGLGVIILGPFISILLIVTVLGILLGLAGLAVVVLLLGLGYALSGVMCGATLAKAVNKEAEISWLWITVGTTFLYGAGFIPVIGPFFTLFFFALTVGGLAISLYRQLR